MKQSIAILTVLIGLAPLAPAPVVVLPPDLEAVGTAVNAATGLPVEVRTRATGLHMCLVPPGDFTMGSTAGDDDEKPPHAVTKSAFYLGKYPLTNAEYEKYDASHKSKRGAYSSGDDMPATVLNWNDASGFIMWVGKQESAYNTNAPSLYAMPSEAAWEKASQGGLASPIYPWGNTTNATMKTIYSSKSAVVVTNGTANGLGFYHMTGNVFCWCWDWYDKDYYASAPKQDPYGPATGKMRAVRGGTWYIYDKSLRCADRWHAFPDTTTDKIGLRIGRRLTDVIP